MKIKLNYEKTQELRNKLWVSRDLGWGDEIHRSDLILCPTRGYARLTGVVPRPHSKLLAFGVMGTAAHDVIEKPFGSKESRKEWYGVWSTLDIMWDKFAEIKTTRLNMFRPSHIPKIYKEQVLTGMVTLKEFEAYLITLDINTLTLLVWDMISSSKEVNTFKHELMARKETLLMAVRSRNPNFLGVHPNECPLCSYKYWCPRWK